MQFPSSFHPIRPLKEDQHLLSVPSPSRLWTWVGQLVCRKGKVFKKYLWCTHSQSRINLYIIICISYEIFQGPAASKYVTSAEYVTEVALHDYAKPKTALNIQESAFTLFCQTDSNSGFKIIVLATVLCHSYSRLAQLENQNCCKCS